MKLRIKETLTEDGKRLFTVQKRFLWCLWWHDLKFWHPGLDPELHGKQTVCCRSIEDCLSVLRKLREWGIIPSIWATTGFHEVPPSLHVK